MNQRIKELAIQAAGKGFQTFATSDFDSQEKIEKFAELIVRECVGILEARDQPTIVNAVKEIKEHFGVAQ